MSPNATDCSVVLPIESDMVTPLNVEGSSVTLLRNPWESALSELISTPENFLLFASPFITRSVAQWIGDQLAKNEAVQRLQILCLTNVRLDSILSGSLELEGLTDLGRSFSNFVPIHIPALHAKVFIADYKFAIITSGNLTHGGIKGNREYGVALRSPKIVRQVRTDFESYAQLGAALSVSNITDLSLEFADLKAEYRAGQRKTLRAAGAEFKNKLRTAEERILSFRARGKSNQSIFCDTIEYVLSNGPLKTVDIHPLVQQIHPDLCNDSEDRIIDGVRFGKRWKHLVRSAQYALKVRGRVSYDGERWHLSHH